MLIFLATLWRYWAPYSPASRPVTLIELEPFSLARSLVEDGEFANPFYLLPTGPSAHLAPLFPDFLALIVRTFGSGDAGAYVCLHAATVAVSILLASLPLLSERLGLGFLNGILAAVFWLVFGPEVPPEWESVYAACLVMAGTFLFRGLLDPTGGDTRRRAALLGLTVGLLALLLPTALAAVIAWLLWLVRIGGRRWIRAYGRFALLIPALLVLPWIVRNYFVFHRFIPIRDNLGLELFISNNDCAQYGIHLNEQSGCFARYHPNVNLEEARQVLALGEPQYNDLRLQQALHWISTHQERFWSLTGQRVLAFWLPNERGSPLQELSRLPTGPRHGMMYGMTLLSCLGLWMLFRRDPRSGLICLLWLGVFPLIYYVIQYEERYRVPIWWLTYILGAAPITAFVSGLPLPGKTRAGQPPTRAAG